MIPQIVVPELRERYYASIRRVLLAFSTYNTTVGYVQGMNIIASCLLFNICDGCFDKIEKYEADAFDLLAALMDRYRIGTCYINNMKKVFELSHRLEVMQRTSCPTCTSTSTTRKWAH